MHAVPEGCIVWRACRVYCPNPSGCGGSCNEYQQTGGRHTQCTLNDKWPYNMCSCKQTWSGDNGDPTAGGDWVAGKF